MLIPCLPLKGYPSTIVSAWLKICCSVCDVFFGGFNAWKLQMWHETRIKAVLRETYVKWFPYKGTVLVPSSCWYTFCFVLFCFCYKQVSTEGISVLTRCFSFISPEKVTREIVVLFRPNTRPSMPCSSGSLNLGCNAKWKAIFLKKRNGLKRSLLNHGDRTLFEIL